MVQRRDFHACILWPWQWVVTLGSRSQCTASTKRIFVQNIKVLLLSFMMLWKYHDTKFSCNSAMTLNIELWPCFKVMKTCLVRRSFYVMHENATMTSVTKIQHKSLPWPWPFSPELVSRLMVTALYRRNTCTCTNIKIFAKMQPGHEISMCLKYCSTARRTLIMHGLDVVNLGLTSWHINIYYIHND